MGYAPLIIGAVLSAAGAAAQARGNAVSQRRMEDEIQYTLARNRALAGESGEVQAQQLVRSGTGPRKEGETREAARTLEMTEKAQAVPMALTQPSLPTSMITPDSATRIGIGRGNVAAANVAAPGSYALDKLVADILAQNMYSMYANFGQGWAGNQPARMQSAYTEGNMGRGVGGLLQSAGSIVGMAGMPYGGGTPAVVPPGVTPTSPSPVDLPIVPVSGVGPGRKRKSVKPFGQG